MVQRSKKRNKLKTYKKQRAPKRSQKQAACVKPRLRKLYDKILTKNQQCIIMDDETYVKLDYSSLPGSQFYTVSEGMELAQAEKVVAVEKFGAKAMVWQAICECGLKSTPFITTSTMNAEIYRNECLKKRLLPMIRKHEGETLFWPDLASCHYARSTTEWMETKGIKYVEKDMNPPNCPEIRPIERFWAIMKAKLRKYFPPSNNVNQFKQDWSRATRMVSNSSVRNLMGGVRHNVREIVKNN